MTAKIIDTCMCRSLIKNQLVVSPSLKVIFDTNGYRNLIKNQTIENPSLFAGIQTLRQREACKGITAYISPTVDRKSVV